MVVVFGVHSLVDWTWYVPGDACVALLCAGWLAGRGPLGAGRRRRPRSPATAAAARSRRDRARAAALGAESRCGSHRRRRSRRRGAAGAWSQWQPQRSEEARAAGARRSSRATRARRVAAAHTRGLARPAVRRSAVRPRRRPAGGRASPRSRARRSQRAVRCSRRTRRRGSRSARYDLQRATRGRAEGAAGGDLPRTPSRSPPKLLTAGMHDREAIEIYNDYVQALRALRAAPAALLRSRDAHGAREQQPRARRAARRRAAPRRCSKPKSASSALSVARV